MGRARRPRCAVIFPKESSQARYVRRASPPPNGELVGYPRPCRPTVNKKSFFTTMKRRLIDRIHDRAWCEVGQWLATSPAIPLAAKDGETSSSISAAMPWADICTAFANGTLMSANFRRNSAVRDIVETVGPVDGRFYAGRIREWRGEWLAHPAVVKIDTWGTPIRWPRWLLGTPRAFSPTTLRYLATALWLKRHGYLQQSSNIIEIGVGFGGLAAMNALVSDATTTLIDLPQVAGAAMRMLNETGFGGHGRLCEESDESAVSLVISNYAFTELNSKIQKEYFDRYIKCATHGVIISNSSLFAAAIRGRTDDNLIEWFRSEGLPAQLDTSNDLLSPGDQLCGVSMIHW